MSLRWCSLWILIFISCKTVPKYTDPKIIAGEALIDACASNNIAAVEEKLRSGVNVNYQSAQARSTCLHYAAYIGSPALAELLFRKGASVDIRDKDDRTPLFESVFIVRGSQKYDSYDKRIVNILFGNGAKSTVNTPTNSGLTPLMMACRFHDPGVVRLFIENGADVNLGTTQRPPIEWAKHRLDSVDPVSVEKAKEIIEILKAHGAKD